MSKTEAHDELKKRLGFEVRKTGSFRDYPANKKPTYCFSRVEDRFYLGDARPEAVKLWNFCVKLLDERRSAQDGGKWSVPVDMKNKRRRAR